MKTQECDVCGGEKYHKHVHRHHIDYGRNMFIWACRECHERIHNEDGFRDNLLPDKARQDVKELGKLG